MLKFLKKLYGSSEDWHSWLSHSAVAALVMLPAVFGIVDLGAYVIGFYLGKEVEELIVEKLYGRKIKWLDHALDLVAPVAVILLMRGLA